MDAMLDQMRQAGLCEEDTHLTDKGREWLAQLEQLANRENAADWAADLVQSINAINR